ncbi:BTB/POZ domain-containing adapter for CUL3-mediated RhoA degradation protein 3-like [Panonychus citri]|uniref:BTB/POZ domain-containing adapter for CUL3-mediated RhoA degradation protein 3-like n=1 Tax=Panonychus citri TaxID=50023 RepID=UPI0023070AD5|nr:BTB/POZ domain-containing adapter for CUL3-mediated RhoA degradation protein 3-like [Panonychus citri]
MEVTSHDDVDEKMKNTHGKYVKLNIGGFLFQTTIATLTRTDCMFKAMFSGRMGIEKDSEGWILIDRNGEHFGTILKYLRDGSVSLPKKMKDLKNLLAEARYYLIEGLIAPCESRLERSKGCPFGQVRMFSSPEKQAEFILYSKIPIVKLSINRAISKHSYTNSSELHFLKNRELFAKLCLKCSSRIIFIQDEQPIDLVCCWSFYHNGEKVSDINCASTTGNCDYNQSLATKVEFPDVKIYEEF